MNSYYQASANTALKCTELEGEHRTDICIIGAGYTGLSSALHLSELGYSVTVVMSVLVSDKIKCILRKNLVAISPARFGQWV